ncbi:L-histidine N(alpha)-methyltransferase [Silvanigrella aquatica]|uniref:Histidine-specific methyltransferase SAM-dependent domain-containing protein n=1 Tax=Silvanigrella aquatica TaxID=1915309 RepID=A0A1L4D0D0_9BACT|nr:L-histidine N(alpha)-methyltransferase [Silvanigrella aquatica]APJ03661.1 hypothetical protein AXG55_06970 [Silvanigrella aquatica]
MKKPNSNLSHDFDFSFEVKFGLNQSQKRIPSKYFYDQKGSHLFNLITEQEEYYLTRIEKFILESRLSELKSLFSHVDEIVEFGPGDGSKAEIILKQFMSWKSLGLNYNAVDISASAVQQCLNRLRKFKNLSLNSIIGDYRTFQSPTNNKGRLFLFLGSNIGNYEPHEATQLLQEIRHCMKKNDFLLIGFDKKKDIAVLTAAYNDRSGITRAFNLNLLERMNTDLGAHFIKDHFSHYGVYNPLVGAMQSFLISKKNQNIYFETLQQSFEFDLGEAIHVENSYKYSDKEISKLAHYAGFCVVENLNDERNMFTNSLWKVKEA